jgi:hypothetical protein
MKKILLWLVLSLTLVSLARAQEGKVTAHTIQLGLFASPKPEEFAPLKEYGYVYEEKQPNGLSKILLGTFSNAPLATKRLAEVKKKGFQDAFLVKTEADEADAVFVIQFSASRLGEPIAWNDWMTLSKDLIVQVWDDQVKVAAGPYRSRIEANENFSRITKSGPKDLFIKKLSPKLFHTVTPFEMGAGPTLSATLENQLNGRHIADLQKLLALEGYYKGRPDSIFSKNTHLAVEAFKTGNVRYREARQLALGQKETAAVAAQPGTLQYHIESIATDPAKAEAALQGNSHPMAQAYLAYLYLTDLIATPDKLNTVNRLMASATKAAFKDYKGNTRFDYTQRYSYQTVQQFLDHLCDMQMATYNEVTVPCFLFDRHPSEMQRAFAPQWGNEKDHYEVSPGCAQEAQFEEVRILQQLAKSFDPLDPAAKDAAAVASGTKDAALVRSLLASPAPPTAAEIQENTEWLRRMLTRLETWAGGGPLQRKMANTYEIAHYEALVKLQYHFLKNGFSAPQAEAIALKVVRFSVQQSFAGFLTK